MFCYGSPDEAEDLCEQYSAQSGVEYRWFREHGAYRVVPVMPDTIGADKADGIKLSRAIRGSYMEGSGQGFDVIVRDCNLPLVLVFSGAKWLVENKRARYIIAPLDVPWGITLRNDRLIQNHE